ncbi:MAG: NADP-specific glutamate dehydrogenase, partial [Brochothrix sp.]|nr:NADP-specific glutamate dehydrogenase [Brochothrix sp.]
VACSDSTGYIYDAEGIDVSVLQDCKEVKRARLTEYVAQRPQAVYSEGSVWDIDIDYTVALPSATQNEIDLTLAKKLVSHGVKAVAEGANMPTSLDGVAYFQENGVLFAPAKAANAGGVATSALEMSQNSQRLSWTFEEVDEKLKEIMQDIYKTISDTAKEYGKEDDLVTGANIAGFKKVADAMVSQGIV